MAHTIGEQREVKAIRVEHDLTFSNQKEGT